MNLSVRIWLYAAALAFSLVCCTYQRKVALPVVGLPEQIYATPKLNNYGKSDVGVFGFTEPPYATRMGKAAAEALYEALLSNGVFARVTLESDVSDLRRESLIDIARARKYRLIIMGDLLYSFEGSLHQPSRVDERITVIDVAKNKTLWYAKATEVALPAPLADYIIAVGRGARAPTAKGLLGRNAEKFCKMLLSPTPWQVSCGAQTGRPEPCGCQ
ncbi:MAG: hypothetical protein HWN68_12580 [Desulfobacterales bacterium]|nr:hypothetical protein [Desulfobacterales bacterium]